MKKLRCLVGFHDWETTRPFTWMPKRNAWPFRRNRLPGRVAAVTRIKSRTGTVWG